MNQIRNIKISGIFVGFLVTIATSIVLSILSPLIFARLVEAEDSNALLTSTGPLSYALAVIFISSLFGVYICHRVAKSNKVINTILVVLLYASFSFWLSTSPSNLKNPYPQWYIVMGYILLIPAAYTGHQISIRMNKIA